MLYTSLPPSGGRNTDLCCVTVRIGEFLESGAQIAIRAITVDCSGLAAQTFGQTEPPVAHGQWICYNFEPCRVALPMTKLHSCSGCGTGRRCSMRKERRFGSQRGRHVRCSSTLPEPEKMAQPAGICRSCSGRADRIEMRAGLCEERCMRCAARSGRMPMRSCGSRVTGFR